MPNIQPYRSTERAIRERLQLYTISDIAEAQRVSVHLLLNLTEAEKKPSDGVFMPNVKPYRSTGGAVRGGQYGRYLTLQKDREGVREGIRPISDLTLAQGPSKEVCTSNVGLNRSTEGAFIGGLYAQCTL